MWNIGCFGVKQKELSKHILWCFELLIILWWAKPLKCICFIWINLRIRPDCSCVHPQMEGEKWPLGGYMDSHLFYEWRGPRPELQVSLALKTLRSTCPLVEICEVSQRLGLWPSWILEMSIAGMKTAGQDGGYIHRASSSQECKSWIC